tara:strand:+ start:2814 stop:3092 length:279 start_codon:yes stop_codon:yes gene_type:complete
VSPSEVALALKLAHLKANWTVVEAVILQIEQLYGEIPLSAIFGPDGAEIHPVAEEEKCNCLFCLAVETIENEPNGPPSDTVWFPWAGEVGES